MLRNFVTAYSLLLQKDFSVLLPNISHDDVYVNHCMQALRMVEDSVDGFGDFPSHFSPQEYDQEEKLEAALRQPNDQRVFAIAHAMHKGYSIDEIHVRLFPRVSCVGTRSRRFRFYRRAVSTSTQRAYDNMRSACVHAFGTTQRSARYESASVCNYTYCLSV